MPSSTEAAHGDTAAVGTAPVPGPRRPGAGRAARIATGTVSVIGELLIAAGLLLGLFVAYSLWWTNVVANQAASRDGDAVRELWAEQEDSEQAGGGTGRPAEYEPEDGIGFLHVPAMSGGEILVKEGTDPATLDGGVAGYYEQPVESAMPWEEAGNFSLAAHRDGNGARFHDIHAIDEGDPIVFETRDTWYVYRAYAILPQTSPFNVDVLDPVPTQSGVTETGRYITLTTCTPMYSSRYRYIVWGELERTEPVDEQRTPPAELAG